MDLPLAPHLPEISAALERDRLLLVEAPPGAGKSTLVPPYLMERDWVQRRRILMLQPRRVAAAAVAARIADLLGEPLGKRAGYRVRSDVRVSRDTRIEVMTEALLTRRIQSDPLLEGVAVVIFDEIHERSLHVDLALALALEVRRARADLALLFLSATPPTESVVRTLGAAVIRVPGRAHPVRTRHAPLPAGRGWEASFARTLAEVGRDTGDTVLAFLPGRGEIGRVHAALAEQGELGGRAVLELHGGLTLEEQRRIIAPVAPAAPRLILSTSIAETSLTVPDVRAVVDSGWARASELHPASGLDRLVTHRVSAASAEQRRGRAGRLGPGLCVRCWPEEERLLAAETPEILRADLAGLVLEARLWGAREPGDLVWLDPPTRAAWGAATELLRSLGFLDGDDRPTPLGERGAALGLSPRLAAVVLHGADTGRAALAAVVAALLEERDAPGMRDEPDFRARIARYRSGDGTGVGAWRAAVRREAERITRALSSRQDSAWGAEDEESAGELLARGYPDRVARREPGGDWRLVTGRTARLPVGPGLQPAPGGEELAWAVAAVVDAGETQGLIRQAAPVTERVALEALEPITVERVVVRWSGLTPRPIRTRSAGKLVLSERPVTCDLEVVAPAFYERLAAEGPGILPWTDGLRARWERIRAYHRGGGKISLEGVTELTETALATRGETWLAGWLVAGGGPVLTPSRLGTALDAILSQPRELDRLAPESVTLPTGSRRRIDYTGSDPAVEARIQEVFGLEATPVVAGKPLTIRLLSPAGRPLQITRDLASFWKNTYPEVRKEMRGRYPRHYWPEDPTTAVPTSRVRPRR